VRPTGGSLAARVRVARVPDAQCGKGREPYGAAQLRLGRRARRRIERRGRLHQVPSRQDRPTLRPGAAPHRARSGVLPRSDGRSRNWARDASTVFWTCKRHEDHGGPTAPAARRRRVTAHFRSERARRSRTAPASQPPSTETNDRPTETAETPMRGRVLRHPRSVPISIRVTLVFTALLMASLAIVGTVAYIELGRGMRKSMDSAILA